MQQKDDDTIRNKSKQRSNIPQIKKKLKYLDKYEAFSESIAKIFKHQVERVDALFMCR